MQRRQSLGALNERISPGVQQLQGLRDKFDFANATAAQFYIAFQPSLFDEFALDALFDSGNFIENILAQGPWIAEWLHHFKKLTGQARVSGDTARFDQHHSL